MSDGLQYHLQIRPGDVGRYAIVPGDPGRLDLIASHLQDPRQIAYNREFRTVVGTLDGERVTVTSTGIGGPSAAIAAEELIRCGADTFIRIGTAGIMQPDIPRGTVVIGTGAVRDEGTTVHYMPVEYPAVAHIDVVNALIASAREQGVPYRAGIVQSKDGYFGEVEPEVMPVEKRLRERWEAWVRGNVLASEMESAALFVVGSVRGVRAGCIMNNGDMPTTVSVAIGALRQLIRQAGG